MVGPNKAKEIHQQQATENKSLFCNLLKCPFICEERKLGYYCILLSLIEFGLS